MRLCSCLFRYDYIISSFINHVINTPVLFRVALQALGQSYGGSEKAKETEKIDLH